GRADLAGQRVIVRFAEIADFWVKRVAPCDDLIAVSGIVQQGDVISGNGILVIRGFAAFMGKAQAARKREGIADVPRGLTKGRIRLGGWARRGIRLEAVIGKNGKIAV